MRSLVLVACILLRSHSTFMRVVILILPLSLVSLVVWILPVICVSILFFIQLLWKTAAGMDGHEVL